MYICIYLSVCLFFYLSFSLSLYIYTYIHIYIYICILTCLSIHSIDSRQTLTKRGGRTIRSALMISIRGISNRGSQIPYPNTCKYVLNPCKSSIVLGTCTHARVQSGRSDLDQESPASRRGRDKQSVYASATKPLHFAICVALRVRTVCHNYPTCCHVLSHRLWEIAALL